jgi:hypothetical protein
VLVLVLVIVIVIEDIENTAMYQHKRSIEKRERSFDAACVVFLVDYEHDYEHEHEHEHDARARARAR